MFNRKKLHRPVRHHKPAKTHHKVLHRHVAHTHHKTKGAHRGTEHHAKRKHVTSDNGHSLHHRGVH